MIPFVAGSLLFGGALAGSGDLVPADGGDLTSPDSGWYFVKAKFSTDGGKLLTVGDDEGLHYWDLDFNGNDLTESVLEEICRDPTSLEVAGDYVYVAGQRDRGVYPAITSVDANSMSVVSDIKGSDVTGCEINWIQTMKATGSYLYAANLKNTQMCAFSTQNGVMTETRWSGKTIIPEERTEGMIFAQGDLDTIVLAIPNYGLTSYRVTDVSTGELEIAHQLTEDDFNSQVPMFGDIKAALVRDDQLFVLDSKQLAYFTIDEQGMMTFVTKTVNGRGGLENGLAFSSDGKSIYVLQASGLDVYDLEGNTLTYRKNISEVQGSLLVYNDNTDIGAVLGNEQGHALQVLTRVPYTLAPTARPTTSPSASPTPAPTPGPTASPTPAPTNSPTASPTPGPTRDTPSPTPMPTNSPTPAPTGSPTESDSKKAPLEKEPLSDSNEDALGMPTLFWVAIGVMGGIICLALIACKVKGIGSGKSGPYGIAKQNSAELGEAINTPPMHPNNQLASPANARNWTSNARANRGQSNFLV